jgi:predicted acylesterase/phospholipase RssA
MFRSIALGGGGVRGGLMIGGLSALQKYQTLEFPDGIYGCSAGALIATAVAYKIPLSAIKHMFETEFNLSTILPANNMLSAYTN